MAGSWGQIEYRDMDEYAGNTKNMFAVSAVFTADATDASIPDLDLSGLPSAFLTDIAVVVDDTTPPDTLTVTVLDIDGATAFTETGITATARVAASDRPALVRGCTVAFSANTTNSAKARVTLYFASNLR